MRLILEIYRYTTLKAGSRHDDNFASISSTGSCRYNNHRWRQWWWKFGVVIRMLTWRNDACLDQVSRTSIVKHHPSNLLMYTASSIVAMVDQEMVTWYAAVCVFVGTTNNVLLMVQSDRTRPGGCAHHAVLCRIQSEWWVKRYVPYSKVWTRCWPPIIRLWNLSRI